MFDSAFPSVVRVSMVCGALALGSPAASALAQSAEPKPAPASQDPADRPPVFDMGRIVVVGTADGQPTVGGAVLTSERMWTFDRTSLDQAVNVVPGVVSTSD